MTYLKQNQTIEASITSSQSGFSLTEVLVGTVLMLVGGLSLLLPLVSATAVKVSSNHQSLALKWIQEDLEQVKSASALWTFGIIKNNSGNLELSGCSEADCNLAVDDYIRLKDADRLHQVTSLTEPSDEPVTVTLSPPIPISDQISFVPIQACLATSADDGLAEEFGLLIRDSAPDSTETRVWKGTTYALERGGYYKSTIPPVMSATPTVKDVAPFNVLELTYRVTPVSGSGDTFVLSTEILPSAALQCP